MYHVISEIQDRQPVYLVEDAKTGERKPGSFDCERIAQAFADYLNEKERDGKSRNETKNGSR